VQIRAQEEIDRVVGPDRLPSTSDRDNLPYVNAIAKEALRWHNVEPLGIPHKMEQDELFEGYLIPKGAIIHANIW
jgi:cytochrome P450